MVWGCVPNQSAAGGQLWGAYRHAGQVLLVSLVGEGGVDVGLGLITFDFFPIFFDFSSSVILEVCFISIPWSTFLFQCTITILFLVLGTSFIPFP